MSERRSQPRSLLLTAEPDGCAAGPQSPPGSPGEPGEPGLRGVRGPEVPPGSQDAAITRWTIGTAGVIHDVFSKNK